MDALRHADGAVGRVVFVAHLSGSVAAQDEIAALADQCVHALIVMHPAVDEAHQPPGIELGSCIGSKIPGTHAEAATANPSVSD